MMMENTIRFGSILIISILALSGCVSSEQPDIKQPVLSWSFNETTQSYTNDQTGIHFPINVNGFERIKEPSPKEDGTLSFSYKGGKGMIGIGLEPHPFLGEEEMFNDDLLEKLNLFEVVLSMYGELSDLERLYLKKNINGKIVEGIGFVGYVESSKWFPVETFVCVVAFEVEDFLYNLEGIFEDRAGAEGFMSFLEELGIEKVVYDRLPTLRKKAQLHYPIKLKKLGIGGVVMVEFLVSKEGSVTWAKAIESPEPRLSALAEEKILSSTFWPGIKNGFPAEYILRVPVNFGQKRKIRSDEFVATPSILTGPNDRLPKALYQVTPKHPRKLKKQGIEGRVTVEFLISKEGHVIWVKTFGSTDLKFATAAKEAVMLWLFEPAIKDGAPVACRMKIPIEFKVNE